MTQQWYQRQVVLLTGGTGTLGGCILYKLAVQLPSKKIFVLCRGSIRRAIETLERSMPEEIHDILDTGKVVFLVGDMTKRNLGQQEADLHRLRHEVTVVINCAANVSLRQDLRSAIANNCQSTSFLLELLSSFVHGPSLLHLSSVYANGFLPSGPVLEQVYSLDNDRGADIDHKREIESIIATGQSTHESRFPVPYAFSKYLADRLILDHRHEGSTLIVRPSNIGPAIKHPFPFYGFDMTIPLHSYCQFLMRDDDLGIQSLATEIPGDVKIDEIPVDLVANTCLLHLAAGTTGVVHATSGLYTPYSVDDLKTQCYSHVAPSLRRELCSNSRAARDHEGAAYFYGTFARFARGWDFDCSRSMSLKTEDTGLLSLGITDHDPEAFMRLRIERVAQKFKGLLANTPTT